jgi:hypothetical protein
MSSPLGSRAGREFVEAVVLSGCTGGIEAGGRDHLRVAVAGEADLPAETVVLVVVVVAEQRARTQVGAGAAAPAGMQVVGLALGWGALTSGVGAAPVAETERAPLGDGEQASGAAEVEDL